MANTSRKRDKSHARRGGSTFLGILFGLVLGLMIALAVAWYINKLPSPFREKAPPPIYTPPVNPAKGAATTAKPAAPPVTAAKDSAPPPPTDKTSTSAAREAFFLQTGSFQNAPDADNLKARLALLGVEASIQTRTLPEKGVWHRVRVGPYTDVEELNRVRDILKQHNIDVALVKVREADR